MTLKTPAFWYDKTIKPTALQKCLLPFSHLYGLAHKVNYSLRARDVYVSKLPVICVGNVTAGGSGKTPTAISIAALLKSSGIAKSPCFLTRGYGGNISGAVVVDVNAHTANDVGDEALLLARHATTIVSANRADGARLAEQQPNIDVIIMDDGLQNPSLYKDLKLLVISGEVGVGNAKLIPAGPLRQPLREGLAGVDGVIITGENHTDIKDKLPAGMPVVEGVLEPQDTPHKDRKYIAFSGLGMPSKFFDFLRDKMGLNIIAAKEFADHHPYSIQDMTELQDQASSLGAKLITTEKDAVRLPKIEGLEVVTVPVSMRWSNEGELVSLLKTLRREDAS